MRNQKKQKTTTITIHCYDIRLIKLIFAVEKERKVSHISTMIPDPSRFTERLQSAASSGRQFGRGLLNKHKASPALGKGKRLLASLADKVGPFKGCVCKAVTVFWCGVPHLVVLIRQSTCKLCTKNRDCRIYATSLLFSFLLLNSMYCPTIDSVVLEWP